MKCFISYARADREVVELLARFLRAGGIETFRDLDDLVFGDEWARQLERAIDSAERVLVFWTVSSSTSSPVRTEYERALARVGCRVVPVILDDTPLPSDLGARQGVDLRDLLRNGPSESGQDLVTRVRTVVEKLPTRANEAVAIAQKIEQEGGFPRIRNTLMALRRDIRLFNGVANSESRDWFGGSESLKAAAYFGLAHQILMTLWRLSESSNPNSLVAALEAAGARDAASRLKGDPRLGHVRRYVQYRLLSDNEVVLNGPSEYVPGIDGKTLQLAMLAELAGLMSQLYRDNIKPSGPLDAVRLFPDPFHQQIREDGLPVVDFVPATIFQKGNRSRH